MGEAVGNERSAPLRGRMVGHAACPQGRYTRLVDRFTLHRAPLDFRALCARVLRPNTRYLLLDMDRTTHRGLNLGELLGWEIGAYKYFGAELFAQVDARRVRGRVLHDPARLHLSPGYFLDGARRWAFPGLSYLLWGKLTASSPFLERWSYRKFGSEPVRAVQRLPQTALLHDIATLPKDVLRMLAQRVWDVAAPLQVIEREDLERVRARCPNIRIILTSASPQPMVEVAGEALGVDGIEFSVTRDLGDRYASPYWVDRRFSLERIEHIASPSEVRINSGHGKIERLLTRYPDLLDPGVESVGISDTGYGEDHSWAQYFSVVVDVNSTTPFPPLVAHDAPLREVHSAQLLTRDERRGARADARDDAVQLSAEQLAPRLEPVRRVVEACAADCQRTSSRLEPERVRLLARLERERAEIGAIVERYNASAGSRPALMGALRRQLRLEAQALRKVAELEQPLSYASMALSSALRESRRELGQYAGALPSSSSAPPERELEPLLEASPA